MWRLDLGGATWSRVAGAGEPGSLYEDGMEYCPEKRAIYVLGGERKNELRKFASWRISDALATAILPTKRTNPHIPQVLRSCMERA
jgi:hypothetical protein